MAESLGAAVLTLTTDATSLLQGIDLAERKKDSLRKSFDETSKKAKQTGSDFDLFGKKLTDNVNATDLLSGGLKKLGGALVAGLSVAAVTSAISSYTNFTGQIADMSAKTGIGAEALQRLKYAAEQNGASIDQVTVAIGKLGANLASGNASAIGALKALGLSFDQIRAMEPDKAFVAIGDAIAGVEDPMARSKLAMDLFGRSGIELLPMMRGNLTETAAAADRLGIVMSESAIQAGDKLGDSLDSLMLVGQSLIGQVLNPMVPAITAVATWLGENLPLALSGARAGFDWIIKKGMELALGFQEMILKIVETGNKIPWLGEKLGATDERVSSLRQSVQFGRDAIAAFDAQTTTTTQTVAKASTTMRTLNLDYDANKKATDAATKSAKDQTEALQRIGAAMVPLTPVQQKSVELWKASNIAITDMAKALGVSDVAIRNHIASTTAAIERARGLVNVLTTGPMSITGALADLSENVIPSYGGALFQATAHTDAFGRVTYTQAIPAVQALGVEGEDIGRKFGAGSLRADEAMASIKTSVADNLLGAIAHGEGFKTAFGNIWGAIKDSTSKILSGILDGFVKNFIGGMLNSMIGSQGNFTSAFGQMTGGLGGVLKNMTGLLSGWVGVAVGIVSGFIGWAVGGLKKLFGGGEIGVVINPARDKWFAGRGVQDIGDELAAVGVDGNTAAQMIKRVFDAKSKDELAASTSAIDKLLGKDGLPMFGDGGLVMKPTIGLIGESGPEAIIPLGKSLGQSTVNVQLDGRVAARAIVPWIPGEVNIMVGA